MAEPATPAGRPAPRVQESAEFRRTHYRVYDEDGYATSFATTPPENATLEGVAAYLCERFDGTGGIGFESKDLVVLLGPRIVAVVRTGPGGRPEVARFVDRHEAIGLDHAEGSDQT
jgi:hypothetical protein